MDIFSLEVFRAVAEEGSFTKAATKLNYVQPNVTSKIQQLENDLHTQLFYRHSRGVTLTSSGRILLAYSDKIFHLIDETRKAVQDNETPSGSFSIGSMETTAAVRLPSILATYHKKYPSVNISFKTGSTNDLINDILSYKLDGAFVSGPIDHPEISKEKAFQEELVLITENKIHGLENNLHYIQNKNVLVFKKGCSYRGKLESWLQEYGLLPINLMEFGTLDAIVGCVMSGFGISLLPISVVNKLVVNGSINIHKIDPNYANVETYFIYRKDLLMTSAIKKFIDTVKSTNMTLL